MIDRVFYNPVENYSRGHPLYPSEISTIEPPHPLGISIDHLWGGGYGYFLESHIAAPHKAEVRSRKKGTEGNREKKKYILKNNNKTKQTKQKERKKGC